MFAAPAHRYDQETLSESSLFELRDKRRLSEFKTLLGIKTPHFLPLLHDRNRLLLDALVTVFVLYRETIAEDLHLQGGGGKDGHEGG